MKHAKNLVHIDDEILFSYVTLQLSFQMWTDQMQETLNSKKKGDTAFHQKDFKAAIENYTQVMFLLQ